MNIEEKKWIDMRDDVDRRVSMAIQEYPKFLANNNVSAHNNFAQSGCIQKNPYTLPYTLTNNLVTLDIKGSLVYNDLPYGLSCMFDIVSIPYLVSTLSELQSENCDTVLLNIDSHGGHISGIEDVISEIEKLREVKKVVAYTNTAMASAAYIVASAAHKIYAGKNSVVGSVGAISSFYNSNYIVSVTNKNATLKSYKEGDQAFIENTQKNLDEYMNGFYKSIAKGRGKSVSEIKEKFGDAASYAPSRALSIGMIDGIKAQRTLIRELKSEVKNMEEEKNKESVSAEQKAEIKAEVLAEEKNKKNMSEELRAEIKAQVLAEVKAETIAETQERFDVLIEHNIKGEAAKTIIAATSKEEFWKMVAAQQKQQTIEASKTSNEANANTTKAQSFVSDVATFEEATPVAENKSKNNTNANVRVGFDPKTSAASAKAALELLN